MEIYLIRHTTLLVEKGICYGQTNLPLTSTFEEESQLVLSKLPSDYDAIFSSPLSRCVALAERISQNSIVDIRLMELNFGEWELKNWNEIPREALETWMKNYFELSPPFGESMNELIERIGAFLDFLKSSNYKTVLVVTHGGPIKIFNGLINGTEKNEWMNLMVDYGEVKKLTILS
jgi:alpha-ribazole phosphatase